MEKLYLRLQSALPGVDHIRAIDPAEFAFLHTEWDGIAGKLDIDSINDLYVYDGEYGKHKMRWHAASRGLVAVRAVIKYYEDGEGVSAPLRDRSIALFRTVEMILDEADLRDIRFCFVGNY